MGSIYKILTTYFLFSNYLYIATSSDIFTTVRKKCSHSHTFASVGDQAFLVSPRYPNSYPINNKCTYKISSPEGTQLRLTCKDFNLQSSVDCQGDRLLLSKTGDSSNIESYCGTTEIRFQTQINLLLGWLHTEDVQDSDGQPYRFNCTVRVVQEDDIIPIVETTQVPEVVSGNQQCTCGKRNWGDRFGDKIVGGATALRGEFPWRCALYSASMGVFCGCSIIDNRWILTAAHCSEAVPDSDTLYVNVGDYDLSTTSETNNSVIRVVQVIRHERYSGNTHDFDATLLKLEYPLEYYRMVQPVCLPWQFKDKSFQGATVTASGWGTTSEGGHISDLLQTVDLPVLTSEECEEYYGSRITERQICTYLPGKDTCQGDSGSSIDYYDPSTGRYYAIGVVSWGLGCAEQNDPGVYTKVTKFLDWIQANTDADFCK